MPRSMWYRLLLALILLPIIGCSSAIVPARSTSNAPAGRLPDGVRPLAYRLHLTIDPRQDAFSGDVAIDIQLDRNARGIWIHGRKLNVSTAVALLPDGRAIEAEYEEVLPTGVARVTFADEVPAGELTLKMAYDASFDRNLAGLFKVEEQGDAYALAKSESIQARKYLPGFDEPGLKATFEVSLTVPAGYVAIGNAPEVDRRPVGEGMEVVGFARTRPMSTYLLSLAVGPFDVVERPPIQPNEFRSEPVPLRGIARRGRGQDLSYVLDVTPRIVTAYERALRLAYPFEKLDIVAAPQWPSGATELSAAITYREEIILVGNEPAPGARRSLMKVHAHEVAHMWLGNLVTPPWWDDLWLKEGFASWAESAILNEIEPDEGHDLDGVTSAIDAMQLDSLASTRAIREPITGNENVRNAYDSITYSKSLGVIHMVDRYFGADRFRPALGRYVESFADGVADSDTFYRVIGKETDTPELAETFRSFVEQKGVPLLEVALQCGSDAGPALLVSQSRYKALGSPIGDERKTWSIPVCVRTDSGERLCLILAENRQTVSLRNEECPTWVLPNDGGSGYYRWNLGEPQWRALLERFDELSPAESLSVIDSAFAAFEAGSLSETILTSVVRKSSSAHVRQVVMAPLQYLRKYAMSYLSDEDRAGFRRFSRQLYQPVLDRSALGGKAEDRLLRSELLEFMALIAKDPGARTLLADKAMAFTGFQRDRDEKALDSDQYAAALIVAVQDSEAGFLEHLIKLRMELDDPRFERASAVAIGRANDPDQLDEIHRLALSKELGARETFELIAGGLAEPAVRDQNWHWLKVNFDGVVTKIPEQWRANVPRLGGAFCDESGMAGLRSLFDEHGDVTPGYESNLAQTVERIQLCIGLRERGTALMKSLSP